MKRIESQELAIARRRVAAWRKQYGGKGSVIPDDVWAGAVKVAREMGVHAASKSLGLNYARLKQRFQSAERTKPRSRRAESGTGLSKRKKPGPLGSKQATFIELEQGSLGRGDRTTVIEFVSPHGHRMRMEMADADSGDLVGIAQSFWGQSS
jgi:hypothetical protein